MTNHRVERRAWRVLGDAAISTPAGRVCQEAGVEYPIQSRSEAVVIGRRRIAHALGKSERTVSRMVRAGALIATRAAGIPNRPLAVSLDKVR